MFSSLFGGGKSSNNLDAKTFEEQYKAEKEAVLLDVRTKAEHKEEHIPGSKLIDIYSPDFQSQIEKLDKNKAYYVYCRSGSRSGSAMKLMNKMGFEKVFNLAGGIMSWHGETTNGK